MRAQPSLFANRSPDHAPISSDAFVEDLRAFTWHGRPTSVSTYQCPESSVSVPALVNEFWTSRQRAAPSLHEISYRACFKPQLPAFFIDRLTRRGDRVYDPFAGRGTTVIEAALLGRAVAGSDVNPLSATLILPRLVPPTLHAVVERLAQIDLQAKVPAPPDLGAFYHRDTLSHLCALRAYLLDRAASGTSDSIDDWIRMVAVNRLTGHSPGFFSVYTLPPNQAVTVEAQRKINTERKQRPPKRDVRALIARKTASLLADVDEATRAVLAGARANSWFHVGSCTATMWNAESLQLVVTSPPFLDVVDYATDNWLRCWFCGIDPAGVAIEMHRDVETWGAFVERAFREFARLLRPGGFVAFEVGEVRRGTIQLETVVLPRGIAAGLAPVCILVNEQAFTKTANIWGVRNNAKGTNTNRIVVFQKAART
jgi:hypothetical protein